MREGDDAAEVQSIGLIPFADCCIEEGLGRRTAGIGDADIDSPELTVSSFDELPDAEIVGDVEGVGVNRDATAPRFFRDLFQRIAIAGAEGEVCAFGSESECGGAADPFAGSGNDGDAIAESSLHGSSVYGGGNFARCVKTRTKPEVHS
jgi:hypothetical protein